MINKYLKFKKGITLIELVLTMAILGLVLSTIFSLNLFGLNTFSLSKVNAENQFEVRMPTDFISRSIRYADSVKILSGIPTNPTFGSHQIYLDNGEIIYKEYGNPKQIIGTKDVGDYSFSIGRKIGTTNVITFTIGKSGTDKFDLTTDVIALNLDVTGITGDTNGIYVEFFTSNADGIIPVSIVNIETPPTKNVQQNAVISTPLRITANMSDGTTRLVAVRWSPSTVDTSTTGLKELVGRVVGYNGQTTFKVYVGNYDLVDLKEFDDIILYKGQAFSMPGYAIGIYSDGVIQFEQEVEVTWDNIITSSTTGEFIAIGDVEGIEQQVQLKVIVEDVSIVEVYNVNATVNQGVTYTLPNTVDALMENGTIQPFPVSWNPETLDTMTSGIKYSNGVTDGDRTVTLTLTVIKSRIPTPLVTIPVGGNNGTVHVSGLAGSTAHLRKSNGDILGTGVLDSNGEVTITGININTLHDVILIKAGWFDSFPRII